MKIYLIKRFQGKKVLSFEGTFSQNSEGINFVVEKRTESLSVFIPWSNIRGVEVKRVKKNGAVV